MHEYKGGGSYKGGVKVFFPKILLEWKSEGDYRGLGVGRINIGYLRLVFFFSN
jgi:hypothetical protein